VGASWFGMQELAELAFDHQETLKLAHQRLVAKLDYSTIAFGFMPKAFSLSELQQVYELISREPVDKRNFRKRICSLNLIRETGRERKAGAHRPARLYCTINRSRVHVIK
jgi:8-oxo-dGTP diphosphatase